MRGAVARRPMPPLMVRGGVERGETEGIRKPGNETGRVETTAFFRGSEIEQTIPQSATLTAPFAQGSHGWGAFVANTFAQGSQGVAGEVPHPPIMPHWKDFPS